MTSLSSLSFERIRDGDKVSLGNVHSFASVWCPTSICSNHHLKKLNKMKLISFLVVLCCVRFNNVCLGQKLINVLENDDAPLYMTNFREQNVTNNWLRCIGVFIRDNHVKNSVNCVYNRPRESLIIISEVVETISTQTVTQSLSSIVRVDNAVTRPIPFEPQLFARINANHLCTMLSWQGFQLNVGLMGAPVFCVNDQVSEIVSSDNFCDRTGTNVSGRFLSADDYRGRIDEVSSGTKSKIAIKLTALLVIFTFVVACNAGLLEDCVDFCSRWIHVFSILGNVFQAFANICKLLEQILDYFNQLLQTLI